MNKRLGWIASVGILAAIVLFTSARLLHHGRWLHGGPPGIFARSHSRCFFQVDDTPASTSRELAWEGSDSIEMNLPGSVQFTVGPAWRAVAEGPAEIVNHLRIVAGRVEFDSPLLSRCGGPVALKLTGPGVRRWALRGSGSLILNQLDQADLDITLNGSGSSRADGRAERTRVTIAGSGKAELGSLASKDVVVVIAGSGDAEIAPENSANIRIAGSGTVRLQRQPLHLQSQINGSGRILSASGPSITPDIAGPPWPPSSPGPPGPG
jgi:hypothetical protein